MDYADHYNPVKFYLVELWLKDVRENMLRAQIILSKRIKFVPEGTYNAFLRH